MYTVDDWLRWIKKRSQLETYLKKHAGALIFTAPPKERDNGTAIMFLMYAADFFGEKNYYAVCDEVIYPAGKARELLTAQVIDNEIEYITGTKQTQKHNERGAGRKPASEDVQNKIRDCISAGLSVRATAKQCGVSVATVQKYK